MKISATLTVALCAVIGITLAQDFNNNFNNNFDDFDDDDSFRRGFPSGGVGFGQSFSTGPSFSTGGGFGGGVGSGFGGGAGFGGGVGYIPVPAQGGASSGLGGLASLLLPLLFLLFVLPNLFNTNSSPDQIILLNSTLAG